MPQRRFRYLNKLPVVAWAFSAVIAQYERESIIQRTKAGLEATRNHGVRVGQPL